MKAQPSYFTQATNFVSSVAGGVDPRTGLYSASISLGELTGNRGLGPVLPVSFKYTPLVQTDTGFGEGFSLGLSNYDRHSGELTLSTGERYRVMEDTASEALFLQQKKLDSFHFEKDTNNNCYRIIHRTGDVELLQGPETGFDVKKPLTLLTASGHALSLAWDDQNRLISVSDDSGVQLLAISYPDSSLSVTTLKLFPQSTETYDVVLEFRNGRLISLKNKALPDAPIEWTFDYKAMVPEIWGTWLTSVTGPGGAVESVIYRKDGEGHGFPAQSGYPPMPYVTHYRHSYGGGQPDSEILYDFTTHNFLGYESSASDWKKNQDNLYNCLTEYIYGSTETCLNGDEKQIITRIYNNYHLQIKEEVRQGKSVKTTENEYYALIGKGFEAQPPQYQLPRQQNVTWLLQGAEEGDKKESQRIETTKSTFDEFGNPLTQTTPEGKLTRYEYYPSEGSGVDCPAEPNGFTRFIKSVTVTPAKTDYTDTPVLSTLYHYATCLTASDRVKPQVLKSTEKAYADKTLIRTVSIDYEAVETKNAGEMVKSSSAHYPKGENGKAYVTTETFSRIDQDDDRIMKIRTVKTDDKLSLTYSSEISRYRGHLLKSSDAQAKVSIYEYDGLGRQVKWVEHPQTEYEKVWHYQFTLDAKAKLPYLMTTTDPLKNQRRDWSDGAGRWIKGEVKTNDSRVWSVEGIKSYDGFGRDKDNTASDWLSPNDDQKADIILTKTMNYDDWGELNQTVFSDGTHTLSSSDPIKRQSIVAIGGKDMKSGHEVTAFDHENRPVEAKRIHADGATLYSKNTFEYDGLGRLRKETDALGQSTIYDYDLWDRVVATKLADGTLIKRQYALGSAEALLTNIAVNGLSQGEQSFDGLGRLTKTISGGRVRQYFYKNDSDTKPATELSPDGIMKRYTYLHPLGEAVSSVTAENIAQNFSYNALTGDALEAKADTSHLSNDFYPSGRLKSTRTVYGTKKERSLSQSYTVLGQTKSVTDWAGETQIVVRDAHGWVKTYSDETLKTQLRYDDGRRLIGWKTSSLIGDNWQDTALVFDDFGREIERVITGSWKKTLKISQSWDVNNRLVERITTRDNTLLKREIYNYDNRNRLINYECSASETVTDTKNGTETGKATGKATGKTWPRDNYGVIRRQKFEYDALSNVTRRVTDYTDGTSNKSDFIYKNLADPCQLTAITHSHPNFAKSEDYQYDEAGRMTKGADGRQLKYDALGRLKSLTHKGRTILYSYDAHNRLIEQQSPDQDITSLYYTHDRLSTIDDSKGCTRLVTVAKQQVAQITLKTSVAKTWLIGTDNKGSVLLAENGNQSEDYNYTVYGESTVAGSSVLGFNGERLDPVSADYHLGNGKRVYSPHIMRFLSPDDLSPFGLGGINPYIYCSGDPINNSDPGGQFSLPLYRWFSLGTAVVLLVIAIAPVGFALASGAGLLAAYEGSMLAATLGVAGIVSDIASMASTIVSGFDQGKASEIVSYATLALGFGLGGLKGIRTGFNSIKLQRTNAALQRTNVAVAREVGTERKRSAALLRSVTAERERNITLELEVDELRGELGQGRGRLASFPSAVRRPAYNKSVQTEEFSIFASRELGGETSFVNLAGPSRGSEGTLLSPAALARALGNKPPQVPTIEPFARFEFAMDTGGSIQHSVSSPLNKPFPSTLLNDIRSFFLGE